MQISEVVGLPNHDSNVQARARDRLPKTYSSMVTCEPEVSSDSPTEVSEKVLPASA